MVDENYWSFGRQELLCVAGGGVGFALLSLLLRAAPPWWFLPLPRQAARHVDTWQIYASDGGYAHFWLQSLVGWTIAGVVLGLIFSNVFLRNKQW